jgi:hypothetical protein
MVQLLVQGFWNEAIMRKKCCSLQTLLSRPWSSLPQLPEVWAVDQSKVRISVVYREVSCWSFHSYPRKDAGLKKAKGYYPKHVFLKHLHVKSVFLET